MSLQTVNPSIAKRDWILCPTPPLETDPFRATRIIDATIAYFRVRRMDFFSPRQTRDAFISRAVCAALLRDLTTLSFPQIGKRIGRDHSTVQAAIKAVKDRPQFHAHFLQLKARLK